MEFSVLKIELMFTLIRQFMKRLVDPSTRRTKKDSNIPSPGEQDYSNAPPQGQHRQSNPHPTSCPTLLFAIYFS